MIAVQVNFLTFLHQPKQCLIPIYQRTYSWGKEQCEQLWFDIMRVGKDESATAHFIGSVVYISASRNAPITGIPQILVIDSQQRLTTVSLLLAAFARALESRADTADVGATKDQIENFYLFNAYAKDDLRHKLLLTRSDRQTLMRLVEGKEPLADSAAPRLVENYRYFAEQIAKLSDAELARLYVGIQKLMIVDISLDRDHDNPQLIFESLNATALKLTESDLIRNFVLMGLEPKQQAELYEEHWLPIEQGFANSGWFDFFVRDYLTIKTGAIPNIRDIYATFKAFVQSAKNPQSIAEIVAEMHRYAGYYVRLTQEKEADPVLRAALHDLNILKVDVARPFLLRLFADLDTGAVNQADTLQILRLIESFVFRRAVCGVPTNTLNTLFASLEREIVPSDYLSSVKAALLLKESYRRFPGDEEFKQAFKVKDVYNFRSRNYLLTKLENAQSKEIVDVDAYTIEHILPQNPNLSPEWQVALGPNWRETQQRVLHTIGNLTLTRYNSEYSDRPFAEKRDMTHGFRDSPLRLNQSLRDLDNWDEAAITVRADALAEKAVRIWGFPDLPHAILSKYKPATLADADALAGFATALQGGNLILFNELRRRIENLDASVQMKPRQQFIGFDTASNFVGVIPYKGGMRIIFNVRAGEINDPKGLCKNISGVGHWGNGDLELAEQLTHTNQLDDVINLVRQAFDRHSDDQKDEESNFLLSVDAESAFSTSDAP